MLAPERAWHLRKIGRTRHFATDVRGAPKLASIFALVTRRCWQPNAGLQTMDRGELARLTATVVAGVGSATLAFSWLEGWRLVDSFYFVTVRCADTRHVA